MVVPRPGHKVAVEDIAQWCATTMAKFKAPERNPFHRLVSENGDAANRKTPSA